MRKKELVSKLQDPLTRLPQGRLVDPEVRSNVSTLAEYPTDGDLVVGAFYKAAEQKIRLAESFDMAKESQTEDRFVASLKRVVEQRLPFSSADMIGKLIFQAYQYCMWKAVYGYIDTVERQNYFDPPPHYRQFVDPMTWHWEIDNRFRNSSFRKLWEKTMIQGVVSTTIGQRYAGVQAVLADRFPDQPISIVDLGCGLNVGLKMIQVAKQGEVAANFDPVVDHTPDQLVSRLIEQPVEVEKGVGIDLQDFQDPDTRLFSRACRYMPSELLLLLKDLERENKLTLRSRGVVSAKVGNVLTDGHLFPDEVDVVTILTWLYQLKTDAQRADVIHQALSHVRPGGFVIVEDFAEKSDQKRLGLDFDRDAWYKPHNFSYGTFIFTRTFGQPIPSQPLKVLEWVGGRCREVRPGPDFEKFFQGYSSSDSADLAHSTS